MTALNETASTKRDRLKEFYYQIKDCRLCELYKTRINFVFGSGNSNAPIVFVGEAPGRNEDLQGKPFVGQAGKLLDELLLFIGFNRHDVFIANVLKCRPPENRDPGVIEINTCKNYLFKQIEIISPMIICTLGRYSTQLILNTSANISKLRGKIFKIGKSIVLPINHPAAALYTPSKLRILREDFKKIREIFDNYEHPENVGEITEVYGLERMYKARADSTGAGENQAGETLLGETGTGKAQAGYTNSGKTEAGEVKADDTNTFGAEADEFKAGDANAGEAKAEQFRTGEEKVPESDNRRQAVEDKTQQLGLF